MEENGFDCKKPLRSLILDQKHEFEKALLFYQKLEESLPLEEHWKIQQTSTFQDQLGEILPGNIVPPTSILETAINTMEEYITAIDNFTADQFSAFLLGVGLTWIPIRYWGIQEMHDYLLSIRKAIVFYECLEAEIPEEEHWKIKKKDPITVLPAMVPTSELMPSDILEKSRVLVESVLNTLADRPF